MNDWLVAAEKQAEEMGIDLPSQTPIFQSTVAAHMHKHLEEGAWNAGSTRTEIIVADGKIKLNMQIE